MKQPTLLWAFFGFDGRLNREVFWLANIFAAIVAALIVSPRVDPETNTLVVTPLIGFVLVPLVWIEVALAVKRLHDRGLTGWLAALLAVPYLNVAAFIIIGVLPGNQGPNKFGPAANTRG